MDNIVLEGLRPPPSLLPFQKPPLGLPTILGNLPISDNFRTPPSPPPPPRLSRQIFKGPKTL